MMENQIDRELLEKIADMLGKPVGAFNIRKDSGCDGRQSTEHIEITSKEDKPGIDIRVKDGTVGETCHIPVIITKPGIEEMVYNDFFIGENCDVNIVAGCGIHNCGEQDSRHDGVHTFYVGKNSRVKYTEKHYGDGSGRGGKIMNPQTIVYLEEGASIQMDTTQIRGIDSTKCYTKIVCGKGAVSFPAVWLRTNPVRSSIPAWWAMRCALAMSSATRSSWAALKSSLFPPSPPTARKRSWSTRPPSARSQVTSC